VTRRAFHHEPEDVRRQALIDAMLDAVADLGLAGANVREVAARASVTPGLIRHYFGSKEQLVETAYASFAESMTRSIRVAAGEGLAQKRLARIVQACCAEPLASHRHLAIWAAFIGVAPVDPAMAEVHREGYRSFRQVLEEVIQDVLKESGRPANPARVKRQAIAVNAVIDGIWLEVSLERATFDDIDINRLALDSILAILGLPSAGQRQP